MWFELYLTSSYEFNSHIPFHDLFELNGVSFSVQTLEVSQRLPRRCARWVYRDAMSTEGRADSLEVLE